MRKERVVDSLESVLGMADDEEEDDDDDDDVDEDDEEESSQLSTIAEVSLVCGRGFDFSEAGRRFVVTFSASNRV